MFYTLILRLSWAFFLAWEQVSIAFISILLMVIRNYERSPKYTDQRSQSLIMMLFLFLGDTHFDY